MPIKLNHTDEELLFQELRKLITELGGIASKYPTLYRIYFQVATPARMIRAHRSERIESLKEKRGDRKNE